MANAQQAAPPAAESAMPAAAAPVAADHAMSGTAAWYGRKFAGRKTASGQRFNPFAMTAAHPTLAFGTRVKVTNTRNKRSVIVTINDRMNSPGRMLDVTQAAAKRLGFIRSGLADVTLEVVGQRRLKRARH
ncbi:MAG: septal ring lytic transglycosylase RlpA family protein [Sterolibacteriaceae bacterium]|uniref:Endolytic peptidoglycan transglycosylase RlpA n=1 Tax=Candidatus Methylophosphatis roskildensis TaxID=2899263 RepID=A0A9D7E274_9PROT|nr:septal ring lytic transglycosylase RlpA family protein [Candidatus Methylophosphatis roskildensis]MBK7235160.1 septal ring lytic transglycosylase RlpA family protein [Sterolibacteriaceae bacterium]